MKNRIITLIMVISSFCLYANSLVFEKSNSEKLSKVTLNSSYIDFYSMVNEKGDIEAHVTQYRLGEINFSHRSPFSLSLLPLGLGSTWVGSFHFNDDLSLFLTCPIKERDKRMVGGGVLKKNHQELQVFFYHTDPSLSSNFYLQKKKLTDLGPGAVLSYQYTNRYSSFLVETAHNQNNVENIALKTSLFYKSLSLSFSHESFLGEMTQQLRVRTQFLTSTITMTEYEESPFGGEGERRKYQCQLKVMKELGPYCTCYGELQRSAEKQKSGNLTYSDEVTMLLTCYPVKLISWLKMSQNPKVSLSITFGPDEYRWDVKVGSIRFLPKSYQLKGKENAFSFSIGSDARCNYAYTLRY